MARALAALMIAAALAGAGAARAEMTEIKVAQQYGIGYLPLMVMEEQKLIEKHAKAMGLGDIKVNWVTIGSGGTSTDSLLAGNLDFVTSGVSNMLLLWSRTGGQVKAVSAASAVPLIFVTRNPNVKTISGRRHWARLTPASEKAMQFVGCACTTARTSGRAS